MAVLMKGVVVEITNGGYGCVMILGGIIEDRKTRLVRVEGRLTAEKYMQDIFTHFVLQMCQ